MKKPAVRNAMKAQVERKPETAATAPQAGTEGRRQKLLIRVGLLLPLLLLCFTLTRGASEKRNLPDYLLGVWRTDAGEYADCYLEITPARVIFGNADGGYALHFVTYYEQLSEGSETTTVVHYTDLDGREYQMSLVYSKLPHETLRLKNQQKVVWERRPES